MNRQSVARTNQSSKSETPLVSGILQRAAVRSISETEMQPQEDTENSTWQESRFHHDFSRVPAYSTTPIVQPKLTIGAVGDKYEQEADWVARQVVSQIHAPGNQTVQREGMPDKNDEESDRIVQRQSDGSGMAATPELEASIQQARGSGQPLSDHVRKPMEQAFGADFSRVKVHADAQSEQMNRSIQAKAFTTGQDIFFRQGAYSPGSRGGQELIAHELTHVVQQNQGDRGLIQRVFDTYGVEEKEETERLINKFNDKIAPMLIEKDSIVDTIRKFQQKLNYHLDEMEWIRKENEDAEKDYEMLNIYSENIMDFLENIPDSQEEGKQEEEEPPNSTNTRVLLDKKLFEYKPVNENERSETFLKIAQDKLDPKKDRLLVNCWEFVLIWIMCIDENKKKDFQEIYNNPKSNTTLPSSFELFQEIFFKTKEEETDKPYTKMSQIITKMSQIMQGDVILIHEAGKPTQGKYRQISHVALSLGGDKIISHESGGTKITTIQEWLDVNKRYKNTEKDITVSTKYRSKTKELEHITVTEEK
jgi:hypothetical protein